MLKNLVFVLLLVCVACGGAPKSAAPKPVAPPPVADDPDRRLTRDECAASVDHATALFAAEPDQQAAADMMRNGRDRFIAQCEATATVRDRDCLMKAKSSYELGLCPMPGGK